jgi:hypothetical protein
MWEEWEEWEECLRPINFRRCRRQSPGFRSSYISKTAPKRLTRAFCCMETAQRQRWVGGPGLSALRVDDVKSRTLETR